MLTGRNIIFISSIEWDFLWQVHQEIAWRLARAGNRVLYIENTGIRSPGLRDAGRVARRLKKWLTAWRWGGVREVAPNVFVVSPLMLPPFGSFGQVLINRHVLSRLVTRTARRLKMRDPILWTYLPTDIAFDLVQQLRTSRSITLYYCLADFAELTPHRGQLRQKEELIVKQSDLVFTNCAQLADHCRQWSDDVHVFAPGVNLDTFSQVGPQDDGRGEVAPGDSQGGLPEMDGATFLQSLPRPVIGYVGGLHKFVDYDLLLEIASVRPEWSWVFVGATTAAIGDLGKLPNVYLVGQRPHGELSHYIRGFDLCLVPYLVNSSTATIVPGKINEYLAVGKPIVATPLRTVCEFNKKHSVLTTAANRPECFIEAIERELRSPDDEQSIRRRREVAALSNWQTRLAEMSALIEAAYHAAGPLNE